MSTNVYYLSIKKDVPANSYWDYGMIQDILSQIPDVKFHEVNKLKNQDRAIVLLPARHHAGLEKDVQSELDKLNHCVFFAMGDEEASFDVDKIKANHIWVQNPHPGKHDKYNKIGTGYPQQIKSYAQFVDKDLDLFFSGQITHKRREQMLDAALNYEQSNNNCIINKTRGFTQGMAHDEYYKNMFRAKIVPCPSGAVIPDSFRLFESLECMAIPIADEVNPSRTIETYWDWLFGQTTPFPKIKEWEELGTKINECLESYPQNVHKQTAWWINWKREFAYKVKEQLNE